MTVTLVVLIIGLVCALVMLCLMICAPSLTDKEKLIAELVWRRYIEIPWPASKLFLRSFKCLVLDEREIIWIMDDNPKQFRAEHFDLNGNFFERTRHEIRSADEPTDHTGTPAADDGIVR